MAKTSTRTSTKKPAHRGVHDKKARAALVAVQELIAELPNSVKVGRVPERIAAFNTAVEDLKPKETKSGQRKRSS